MREVTVTLGGQARTIRELPTRRNAEFRARLQTVIGGIVDLLQAAPDADLEKPQEVGAILRAVSDAVLRSPDTVIALVLGYAPDLEGAMEDAYDSEIADAFWEVLKLAYPFFGWGQRLREVARQINGIGSQQGQTLQSLPVVNGESGMTNLTSSRSRS